ncbi:NAD(P)H-dependent oxidoreductase [Tsuneonella sp. SYSU-LHT278]|uniref:NAD(P)H-dependent oxidoreductase n=1 Tax=Tsuneonella sediminis TaxID=3416089 RepID=UPI003F797C30
MRPKPATHAIIACHPAQESFTMSMAARYADAVKRQGHTAILRDLYRCGFDPVLTDAERHGVPGRDVEEEWAVLGEPEVFVLVYPIWYGAPPAMLKGYVERVFGAGRQLGRPPGEEQKDRLAGRHLVSLTSSGQLYAWLKEKGVPASLRTIFDRYQSEVLGFSESRRHHFDGITETTPPEEIREHLAAVEAAAGEVIKRLANGPPEIDPYRHLRDGGPP